MDDDKTNPEENPPETINQSGPIYESVPEENLKPEEVAPEVETASGEGITPEVTGGEIPSDIPPVVYEENKNKYFIIAGGAIFFLLVLLFFLRVFFGKTAPAKEVKLTSWGLWEEKEV